MKSCDDENAADGSGWASPPTEAELKDAYANQRDEFERGYEQGFKDAQDERDYQDQGLRQFALTQAIEYDKGRFTGHDQVVQAATAFYLFLSGRMVHPMPNDDVQEVL